MKSQILNKKVVWEKRRREIARKIIYSRVVFTFILIILQIVLFFLFILKFKPYTEAFLGTSISLSFLFMIYLSNCKGHNEFKIAWLLPLVIFPLFGVSAYILYHLSIGGVRLKKNILKVKQCTSNFLDLKGDCGSLYKEYPDIKGISEYLIKADNYLPYKNCNLLYLKNGESYFEQLLLELKKAKKFIFIEYFIIDNDESWSQILEILEQKIKQGVEVRILFDSIGSIMVATKRYCRFLRSKGIKARVFLKLIPLFTSTINNRDHRKIFVIDGKVCFTGGINLSNEYFNVGINRFTYWKDSGVKITGNGVKSFVAMFLQDWNLELNKNDEYEKYLSIKNPVYEQKGVIIPYGDDAYNNEDIAENVYLHFITTAKKYIYISTPYLLLDNHLLDELIFAAKRGVDVKIFVPSVPDHFITYCIGKTFVKDLINNGVNVYFYKKGFIHAKNLLVDDVSACVGSINLDYRSFCHHFECGVIIHKSEVLKDIYKDFEQVISDSEFVTKRVYKKIPKRYLVIGRLFRIFAPLM